jgi:serine/threonine-protein kinase
LVPIVESQASNDPVVEGYGEKRALPVEIGRVLDEEMELGAWGGIPFGLEPEVDAARRFRSREAKGGETEVLVEPNLESLRRRGLDGAEHRGGANEGKHRYGKQPEIHQMRRRETGYGRKHRPCNDTVVSTTPVPEILGGYELLHEIGRGRTGVVYRVRTTARDRPLVLKVVHFQGTETEAERESYEERFFQEARRAARLSHPGIASVVDAVKDAATGALCLVSEQVNGRPLSSELEAGKLVSWREALSLVERVADALHHAHEREVVHRAIMPGNVLLLPTGEPKVTDFGLAELGRAGFLLWPPAEVSDALRYLSPEQVVGEPLDTRTDIFSLGALAYRLLTGEAAFDAPEPDPRTTCSRIVHDEPEAPSRPVPALPEGTDDVIARALAKSRKDRYPDAGSLSQDINDILEGRLPRHASNAGKKEDRATRTGAPPSRIGTAPRSAMPAESKGLNRRLVSRGVAAILAFGLVAILEMLRPATEPRRATMTSEAPGLDAVPRLSSGGEASVLPDVGLPSIKEPSQSGRLVVELQHPLRAGTLRISIDDGHVAERAFSGSVTRSILGIELHGGLTREVVEVDAGSRRVTVVVKWKDRASSASIVGAFEEGSTRRLSVRLGRFSKGLELEWQ